MTYTEGGTESALKYYEEDLTSLLNHSIRVSNLAYCVAKEYGLYESPCHELAVAGMLHDIGKLKVSSYLFGRQGDTLRIEEMKYLRMHPRLGYEIVMRRDYSDFICESILYHHENYDGSGYQENLRGDSIPIGARILRVCDVYAALTSDRPYRSAFDKEAAIEMMIDEAKNYDMKVFMAFLSAVNNTALEPKWADPELIIHIYEEEGK